MSQDIYPMLEAIWRRELESELPQPLPHNFYDNVRKFLVTLMESSQKTTDEVVKAVVTEEMRVIRSLIEYIVRLRLCKVLFLTLVHGTINESNLTPEEAEIYRSMRGRLDSLLTKVSALAQSSNLQRPADVREGARKENYVLLRFIKPCPEFVGIDGMIYGPFEAEEVANLPKDNAEALISRGIAVRITIDLK